MKLFKKIASFVLASGVFFSSSVFADTVKIAFIDPLSGPFATTGTIGLAEWKYAAEKLVNEKGGVLGGKKMEIVALDNKMDGKESLVQVQVAIDQGIRFIAQGNSSGIANAITDMVKKHNKRNANKSHKKETLNTYKTEDEDQDTMIRYTSMMIEMRMYRQ